MKSLIEQMAKALVDRPEEVSVAVVDGEGTASGKSCSLSCK